MRPARRPAPWTRTAAAVALLLFTPMVGGCAVPFAAGIGLSEIVSIASLTGTIAYNKGATDLALDLVTGEDCRVVEAMVREDRDICETIGSDAAGKDFKGVVGEVEDGDLVVVGHRRMETHDGAEIEITVFGVRPEAVVAPQLAVNEPEL